MTKELGNEIVQHVGPRLKRDYAVDETGLPEEIARGLQRLRQREEALSRCGACDAGGGDVPLLSQHTGLAAHAEAVEIRASKPPID